MTAFRPATPADIPALHTLIERAYRGDSARAGWTHEADLLDGQRTDAEALAAMLADPTQVILLAEGEAEARSPAHAGEPEERAERVLTGCVAVRRLADGAAYVGLVTVDPAIQSRGLGRALLGAADDAARAGGAVRAEMTVIAQRAELIAWYERRGWRLTGERRPFPLDDPRFGLPRTQVLEFVVLGKSL